MVSGESVESVSCARGKRRGSEGMCLLWEINLLEVVEEVVGDGVPRSIGEEL